VESFIREKESERPRELLLHITDVDFFVSKKKLLEASDSSLSEGMGIAKMHVLNCRN